MCFTKQKYALTVISMSWLIKMYSYNLYEYKSQQANVKKKKMLMGAAVTPCLCV